MPLDEQVVVEEAAKSPCRLPHIAQLHTALVKALLSNNPAADMDSAMAVETVEGSVDMLSHHGKLKAKASETVVELEKAPCIRAAERARDMPSTQVKELAMRKSMLRDESVRALAVALDFVGALMHLFWEVDLVFWAQYFG